MKNDAWALVVGRETVVSGRTVAGTEEGRRQGIDAGLPMAHLMMNRCGGTAGNDVACESTTRRAEDRSVMVFGRELGTESRELARTGAATLVMEDDEDEFDDEDGDSFGEDDDFAENEEFEDDDEDFLDDGEEEELDDDTSSDDDDDDEDDDF